MKLVLYVHIVNEGGHHLHTAMIKELQVNYILPPGIEFEDGAWGHETSRKPDRVILNAEKNECFVHFGKDKHPDLKTCEEIERDYLAHGWRRTRK